jgi:hypothetical protein
VFRVYREMQAQLVPQDHKVYKAILDQLAHKVSLEILDLPDPQDHKAYKAILDQPAQLVLLEIQDPQGHKVFRD